MIVYRAANVQLTRSNSATDFTTIVLALTVCGAPIASKHSTGMNQTDGEDLSVA